MYVDAFNVYYGGRALCGRGAPGWRWLDLAGLALDLINPRIWPDPIITTLAYCTALRDREGDSSSLADQRTYLAALRRVNSPGSGQVPPWLPIEEVTGPSGCTELLTSVSTFEEKGSDVNVAHRLATDVLTGRIDAAMIFTNDSDLRMPFDDARQFVHVALINPSPSRTATDLRGATSVGTGRHWWRKLRVEDFRDHQLPDPVGPYAKPVGW